MTRGHCMPMALRQEARPTDSPFRSICRKVTAAGHGPTSSSTPRSREEEHTVGAPPCISPPSASGRSAGRAVAGWTVTQVFASAAVSKTTPWWTAYSPMQREARIVAGGEEVVIRASSTKRAAARPVVVVWPDLA